MITWTLKTMDGHSSIQAAPCQRAGGVNVEHAQRSEHERR
jgi:hypothetical protein